MNKGRAKLSKSEKSMIKRIDAFVWIGIVIAALVVALH
jgi:hypothetical protein